MRKRGYTVVTSGLKHAKKRRASTFKNAVKLARKVAKTGRGLAGASVIDADGYKRASCFKNGRCFHSWHKGEKEIK
jgi:hypothetical protein